MYSLVVILMVLVCFNFVLKQSWHKWWSVLAHAAAAALFTGLMWPVAVRQSRSQIEAWLANPDLMLDTSVVITLEVILQISFCLLSVHLLSSGKLKSSTVWGYRILRWFPGVLIFGVLFSFLVYLIFAFPGVSFPLVAWSAAAVVFVVIAGGAWLMRWIFPDKESRLEMFFLTNALTGIVAVIATVNGQTAVAGVSEVDWRALAGVLGLIAAGVLAKRMNYISDVLFWISNGLLVPVVVLLILFFLRSLLLIGNFFGQYLQIRKVDRLFMTKVEALTPATVAELRASIPSNTKSPLLSCLAGMLDTTKDRAHRQLLLSDYEIAADKDLGTSKTLSKMGPMLGLMGTLIPMGPALVGLSTGDIGSMAYNMQVAFATTVVGLFSAAIGFITQQVKQRWYTRDLNRLEFVSEVLDGCAGAPEVETRTGEEVR